MSHRALIAALVVFATALTDPALAQENLVKLYSWSGYVSPTVLESFSRATGIKTVVETYETKE
jgi:putrescine transport system substrate-binding protein